MRRRSASGFTLIELVITVAIVGILAAVAIPALGNALARSKQSEARSNLGTIYDLERAFHEEAHRFGNLVDVGFVPEGANRYSYCAGDPTQAGSCVQSATDHFDFGSANGNLQGPTAGNSNTGAGGPQGNGGNGPGAPGGGSGGGTGGDGRPSGGNKCPNPAACGTEGGGGAAGRTPADNGPSAPGSGSTGSGGDKGSGGNGKPTEPGNRPGGGLGGNGGAVGGIGGLGPAGGDPGPMGGSPLAGGRVIGPGAAPGAGVINPGGGGPGGPIGRDHDSNGNGFIAGEPGFNAGAMGGAMHGGADNAGGGLAISGNPHVAKDDFEADAYGRISSKEAPFDVDKWLIDQQRQLVNFIPGY